MPFGNILPVQAERIRPHVRGRAVHDLGSGHDLILSFELLDLGASKVTAVDTYSPGQIEKPRIPGCVTYVRNSFENIDESIDVAFVSWPSSRENPGLTRLLRGASVVIYLGKCMDGLMCGSPDLFRYLSTRHVFAYEPDRNNTLIIYGGEGAKRPLLREELAGIDYSTMYFFDETLDRTGT